MTPEEAIRQKIALLAMKLDDRDVDGVVALFTPAGRLITRNGAQEGREALKGFWDALMERTPGRRTKHTLSGAIITVNGETAEAITDILAAESVNEAPWSIYASARYEDKFVFRDGDWWFTERTIVIL